MTTCVKNMCNICVTLSYTQRDNLINFFSGGYYFDLHLDLAVTCQLTYIVYASIYERETIYVCIRFYMRETILKMCIISKKKLIFCNKEIYDVLLS